jgi:hypothetical protein
MSYCILGPCSGENFFTQAKLKNNLLYGMIKAGSCVLFLFLYLINSFKICYFRFSGIYKYILDFCGISSLVSVSLISQLNFGTVPTTVVFFIFHIISQNVTRFVYLLYIISKLPVWSHMYIPHVFSFINV